jgi:NAD kinase
MEKIIIVHRPTRLDSLVAKFNTRQQAKFYVEHLNADFSDYELEHEVYYSELDKLSKISQQIGNVQLLGWKYLPNFMFGKKDLVITIGQDGLVANTLKYLDDQKLIGINPDFNRWDGLLSQFSVDESELIIKQTLNDESVIKQVTKAKVQLSDNQTLYAVNDFFIGVKNHSSARYSITVDNSVEHQSSSGIIVSTPLGRSGWMKSVLAGASGITNKLTKQTKVIKEKSTSDWSKNQLTFAVREPFPSINTSTNMVFGTIKSDTQFSIESKMGENGFIFSDGIQEDYLDFNYSVVANISVANLKGNIVTKKT